MVGNRQEDGEQSVLRNTLMNLKCRLWGKKNKGEKSPHCDFLLLRTSDCPARWAHRLPVRPPASTAPSCTLPRLDPTCSQSRVRTRSPYWLLWRQLSK